MTLSISQEVFKFINACENDFCKNIYKEENIEIATVYINLLQNVKKTNDSNIVSALINKLKFIRNQIQAMNDRIKFINGQIPVIKNKLNYNESILDIVPLSVTDYIINLVKENRITNNLLIARYVYIELSRVLYYDISYVKQEKPNERKLICNAPVDVKNEKIFSYVVCTQWLKLYTYILKQFGIDVQEKRILNQDHVWGEIELNDKEIIIVDATDYINSSIDLSNAKSMSETVGFVVLPKEYSGIKLYDMFYNKQNIELAKKINSYYKLNRELDMTLGYIKNNMYENEIIIKNNDIFNYPKQIITNQTDITKFTESTYSFFDELEIPTNMDGYEIYAYYDKFLKKLPKNISGSIAHETIYVDSFFYKQNKMRYKFLHAPIEYLMHLEELVYNRYYRYLYEEENNNILEDIKEGKTNSETLSHMIAEYEMKIAEVNRNINFYYALDKLHFYKPYTGETIGIRLYEPMMGKKQINSYEKYQQFVKKIIIK